MENLHLAENVELIPSPASERVSVCDGPCSTAPNERVTFADIHEAAEDRFREARIVEPDGQIGIAGVADFRPRRADLDARCVDAIVGSALDRLLDGLEGRLGLEIQCRDVTDEAVAFAGECADGCHVRLLVFPEAALCGLACTWKGATQLPSGRGGIKHLRYGNFEATRPRGMRHLYRAGENSH